MHGAIKRVLHRMWQQRLLPITKLRSQVLRGRPATSQRPLLFSWLQAVVAGQSGRSTGDETRCVTTQQVNGAIVTYAVSAKRNEEFSTPEQEQYIVRVLPRHNISANAWLHIARTSCISEARGIPQCLAYIHKRFA